MSDEETEISWIEHLKEFNDEIYPVFERQGFSRDTALQAWMMNRLFNLISDMLETDDDGA